MIDVNNYKIKMIFSLIAILVFTVAFFYEPSAMSAGMRNGLYLCTSTIIPSMFPFLIVSDFLIRSGLCTHIGRFFSKIIKAVFRLPGSSACVILMSLIGGFPVGAKMTAQLIDNKDISKSDGKRLVLFCVNAGPAFTISAVGDSMLKSKKAGIIIYISLVLSSLIIGFIARFFAKKESDSAIRTEPYFDTAVFVGSVSESARAVINICAWVLVFSSISGYLIYLPLKQNVIDWINIFGEVTNGCSAVAGRLPVFILAFVIGWAGLSVHCQVYEYVRKTGLAMWKFLIARFANGTLATAICYGIMHFFPCEINVFSSNTQILAQPYSVSLPAAVAMIILAGFLLVDSKIFTAKT